MKRLLYIVWQYTWGLLQNLAGGTIYAFYRLRGCPHFAYQGALAVIWPVRSGSMSLGRFLFLKATVPATVRCWPTNTDIRSNR